MLEYLCLGAGLYCTALGVACLRVTRRAGRDLAAGQADLGRRWEALREAERRGDIQFTSAGVRLDRTEQLLGDIDEKRGVIASDFGRLAQMHKANEILVGRLDFLLDEFGPVIAAVRDADAAHRHKRQVLAFAKDAPSQV